MSNFWVLTDKHSNTHATHGNHAGDVKSSAALRTHQTVLGAHATSAAAALPVISGAALTSVARVLLGNNFIIGWWWSLVILLHGWSPRSGLREDETVTPSLTYAENQSIVIMFQYLRTAFQCH